MELKRHVRIRERAERRAAIGRAIDDTLAGTYFMAGLVCRLIVILACVKYLS